MSTVIQIEKLSKCYRLGTIGGGTLRADVSRWLAKLRSQPDPTLKIGQETHARLIGQEFWALQDVSFEVQPGEILGIIGRNGAGKSTLLKILSRVTAPSSGEVRVKGRIASLLEVGTGFHPELTGRENIVHNGAILGMTKVEIRKKFDEIVSFSGVEQHIDTPVKRYSSGMFVRLAFAVAAHLEPEILVLDEVLAVGDAEFQKKCLEKMKAVSTQGRTILFVSHNMASVSQLCDRTVYLESGRIHHVGETELGVRRYFNVSHSNAVWNNPELTQASGKYQKLVFTKVELVDLDGQPSLELDVRKPFKVRMSYQVPADLQPVELAVRVLCDDGRAVMTTLLSDCDQKTLAQTKRGNYQAIVEFPPMFFMPGSYHLNVAAHAGDGEIFHLLERIFSLSIVDTGTNFSKYRQNQLIGVVMRNLAWTDEKTAG